nr:MAG TPA: Single strand binding protein [Caudoviricetes sp.]
MEELTLTGNLGADPELRATRSGKSVANFSLAVAAGRDAKGERITHWYDCEAWEKTADVAQQYLRKGSKVLVRGVPRAEAYLSKQDGKPRATLRVTVRTLEMLDSRASGSEDAPAQSRSGGSGGYTEVESDELPF